MANIILKGMAWSHERGISPMIATSDIYSTHHPHVCFTWDNRSLQDFESQPLRKLAEQYDVIVIDHPHVGQAIAEGLLCDFNQTVHMPAVQKLATQSVGKSHDSYYMQGGQYALAIDTACPVACYRPDVMDVPPNNWQQVVQLAQSGKVAIPLRSPHALMMFFWIANTCNMPIAPDTHHIMIDSHIDQALDICKGISMYLDDVCYISDPIAILDAMANTGSDITYCPHIYGYINYSRQGFRDNIILFDDIIPIQDNTTGKPVVGGSVLGGTGIAVSALSQHQDIALEYAVYIASAPCQKQHWVQNGGQPGNKIAWTDTTCNALCHHFMENTLTTLENAWLRPRYNGYLTFQAQGSDIICDFLQGHTNKTQTIQDLQHLYRTTRT